MPFSLHSSHRRQTWAEASGGDVATPPVCAELFYFDNWRRMDNVPIQSESWLKEAAGENSDTFSVHTVLSDTPSQGGAGTEEIQSQMLEGEKPTCVEGSRCW